MIIDKERIEEINVQKIPLHKKEYDFLCERLAEEGVDVELVIEDLIKFQVAVPSWALGAGGTRFARFPYQGEPANLVQKIEDVGLIHRLTQTAGAISLHIPWDIPEDYSGIKGLANSLNIKFDAVNSNTFQDQVHAKESYKYGSLADRNKAVREQAIHHNIEVINIGEQLGSKSLTVWLADGASFPGQNNFQESLQNTERSLKEIYNSLPEDWKLLIEYKPYEPNFYSTVIQDWGTSFMLANACGERATTLVDLGHHLPNTNIEQIVATLMYKGKLGGFHFNDSKYGDDDLTVGSVKPYALFLIFNELVYGMRNNPDNPELSWMIDASHNLKDPIEDLMQSLEAIQEAYAKALLINQEKLREAQRHNDIAACQEILQKAYRTDVRPLIRQARLLSGGALNPIEAYRNLKVREVLVKERGANSKASGL